MYTYFTKVPPVSLQRYSRYLYKGSAGIFLCGDKKTSLAVFTYEWQNLKYYKKR